MHKVKALNVRVRYLRSDNGGEYISKEFGEYCKAEGITRHLTTIYTSQQNAVCERLNRTVLKKVRSMMSQSGLPYKFWAEAVNTAVYLINLSPSSAIDFSTPFELRHKRVADYNRIRIFGCTAYPLIPKEHRTKLDPTSKKCRFLGYASGVKSYKLWDLVAYRDDDGNALILEEGEPSSYREAQASTDKLEWDAAMERETTRLGKRELMSKIPYDKAVGSLMYLMISTRPDNLAMAMGKISRYMSNPGKMQWEAVKWILRQTVSHKKIELVKIDGKLNPADAFTKVSTLESFARHRSTLQIVDVEQK
ncbi:hypothetical protein AXG93_4170s1180 [Marchantia polymorpha subsp. ruderalis]|uniref:Integrase catalytic domain-containing protein n=1 Tax=Marchantia polymorpha subsp. ruderalis TaxID=1480154 RepID=A0A176VM40_MARPO|nr:hypothetical protein AXG93_4170s1180 [Marchantia polymorpha subsp. ruderalis]